MQRALAEFGDRVADVLEWTKRVRPMTRADRAALRHLQTTLCGFFETLEALGYELPDDFPLSAWLERAEAAGLLRPRDKTPK